MTRPKERGKLRSKRQPASRAVYLLQGIHGSSLPVLCLGRREKGMRTLVTAKQMKAIDAYTIQTIGVPSMVLMERAALYVAQEA